MTNTADTKGYTLTVNGAFWTGSILSDDAADVGVFGLEVVEAAAAEYAAGRVCPFSGEVVVPVVVVEPVQW